MLQGFFEKTAIFPDRMLRNVAPFFISKTLFLINSAVADQRTKNLLKFIAEVLSARVVIIFLDFFICFGANLPSPF